MHRFLTDFLINSIPILLLKDGTTTAAGIRFVISDLIMEVSLPNFNSFLY